METESPSLEEQIKTRAYELGFEACGITTAVPSAKQDYVIEWLNHGKAGEMVWLAKNAEKRVDLQKVLPGAQSVVVVGLNYFYPEATSAKGRIARYARGQDYHKIMEPRLKQLAQWIETSMGGKTKWYVDTGPILEREVAARAGIGWQGKSTMLISRKLGTWFFLGEVLTTVFLAPDRATPDYCGRCTRCIESCPTQAITGPYQLDARRCLSYLTIEYRGSIPEEFRRAMGGRIYGCDDCLEVCPWNRFAKVAREEKLQPMRSWTLTELLQLSEEEFQKYFQHSPIRRVKRRGLQRNVCVALGNVGKIEDIFLLEKKVLENDEVVAEHAKWAIREIQRRLVVK